MVHDIYGERVTNGDLRQGAKVLFNSRMPDGRYSMDLSVHDEREVCEHLVLLAVDEPGENWKDEILNGCVSTASTPVHFGLLHSWEIGRSQSLTAARHGAVGLNSACR